MGGVDRCDQLRGTFSMDKVIKTKFWYKQLFFGILGLAMANAYTIFHIMHPDAIHRTFVKSLQQGLFLEGVARGGLEKFKKVKRASVSTGERGRLSEYETHHLRRQEDDNALKRQLRCRLCGRIGKRHLTWLECTTCDPPVPLCGPTTGRDCHHLWHTLKSLPARVKPRRESKRKDGGEPVAGRRRGRPSKSAQE